MGNWTVLAWPILISAALKSTLVLGVAWILATLLKRRSAAARHIVWTACAAALLGLPLLSLSLPALRLPFANRVLPADSGLVFRANGAVQGSAGEDAGALPGTTGKAARAGAIPSRPLTNRDIFVLFWALGIAASLLQIAYASLSVWRIRRRAHASPDQATADALALRLGIEDPVRVLEAAAVMPMTFGIWRPTVLLPDAARNWSEDRRQVVLLHELAHIARGDAATQLLARAALALHWWNPLAWMAWREFLKERERAADDLVLDAGTVASEYAEHLLEIARAMQRHAADSVAGVAMARRSELEGRLLSILDGDVQRGRQRRAAALAAAALAVALIAPLAAVRAQSQADQSAQPAVDETILAATQQKNHEILDRAAFSYEQIRKWAEAQKLREASLALAEQTSGQASKEYTIALVKLGDLARQRGSVMDAQQYYTRALDRGDSSEVFPVLIALGRMVLKPTVSTWKGGPADPAIAAVQAMSHAAMQAAGIAPDPAKALEYFTRARNVAANGNDMATALTNMALVRMSQPEGIGEVESLFNSAASTADPGSAEQALALEYYAQFLKGRERASEAEPMEERARAIRRDRIRRMGPPQVAVNSVFKVGGGVSAPRLLYKVEPAYSEEARAAKYQGTVVLSVVIDVDGQAKDIDLIKALGLGLDEKAVLAINQWKFKPGEKDGLIVPVRATIEVNFRMM
ncbi:MAG: TonB family protein [Candidatus Solibacter sp.]